MPQNNGSPNRLLGKGSSGRGIGSDTRPTHRRVQWADLDDNANSDSWVQVVKQGLPRNQGFCFLKGFGKSSKGSVVRGSSGGQFKGSGKGKGGKSASNVKPSEFALHPAASIVGVGAVVKALESGRIPEGSVALANDVKTVENLRRLAKLHELDGTFAVVLNPACSPDSVPDDADRHKIPMARSGLVCLQDVWVWPLVTKLPCLPKAVVKQAQNVAQPDSLTVYKAHLPLKVPP